MVVDVSVDNPVTAQPPPPTEAGKNARPRMGDLLVERGILTVGQLQECLALQRSSPGERLGQILIRKGYAKEDEVMECLAAEYGLDFVRVSKLEVPRPISELLPADFCRRYKVMVIGTDDERGTATVATSDPANVFLLDEVRHRLGRRVRLAVTTVAEITKATEELPTGLEDFQLDDLIRDIADDSVEVVTESEEEVSDLARVAGESPVVRLANYLICNAVKEGASDIHAEPGEKKMRIRYRIDGVLFEVMSPPQTMHPALVSRLKIMANLTSRSGACPRTAASGPSSATATWTSASARCRRPRAKRPSSASSTTARSSSASGNSGSSRTTWRSSRSRLTGPTASSW